MTKKYETPGPDGQPVQLPASLLEEIATDVRNFDRAESPSGRMAYSLKKISMELPRLRDAVKGHGETLEERLYLRTRVTALAVQVAQAAGYSPEQISQLPRVREVLEFLERGR